METIGTDGVAAPIHSAAAAAAAAAETPNPLGSKSSDGTNNEAASSNPAATTSIETPTKSQHAPLLPQQQQQQQLMKNSNDNPPAANNEGSNGLPSSALPVDAEKPPLPKFRAIDDAIPSLQHLCRQSSSRSVDATNNTTAASSIIGTMASSDTSSKSQHLPLQQQQQQQQQQQLSKNSDPDCVSSASDVATNGNTGPDSNKGHGDGLPTHFSAEKHLRRKNRRRLHRLLNNPEIQPSFLKVIQPRKKIKTEPDADTTTPTNDAGPGYDSDESFLLEPPRVVIDVDEYIGLRKKRALPEMVPSAPRVGSNAGVFSAVAVGRGSKRAARSPRAGATKPDAAGSSAAASTTNPADEGWYEGVYPMGVVPEDDIYLTQNQKWIRRNMEYFSATEDDVLHESGRRAPMVRGRVGFRCIHCAKAFRSGRCKKMMAGSVSFPVNFLSLYHLAIQKQLTHLEQCPHTPPGMKWSSIRNDPGHPELRKRMKNGVSGVAYWNISCRRLGIVELGDNVGLRFGRDLKLGMLPFQSVRIKTEKEQPALFRNTPKPRPAAAIRSITPATVSSSNHRGVLETTTTSAAAAVRTSSSTIVRRLPKAVTDIVEKAESDTATSDVLRKEDSASLSNYMFLTIKQATLCHAVKEDFATKGKKTKLMRLGFAGLCCRYCKRKYYTKGTSHGVGSSVPGGKLVLSIFQNSCRSFSSSYDNLGSALIKSFPLHILKCPHTPQKIKRAINVLKRLHAEQMQEKRYGSQSKVFSKIWERIRAADKPAASDGRAEQINTPIGSGVLREKKKRKRDDDDKEYSPETISFSVVRTRQESPAIVRSSAQLSTENAFSNVNYVAYDEEIRQTLKNAEKNWDPSQNSNLILPEDRKLVTDFVFLCMRQLEVALPTDIPVQRNRNNRMAGLRCIHCSGTRQTTRRGISSGRSFLSAPDAMASVLHQSMYNHIMHCQSVPTKLRRAIDAVRRLHRDQCSRMPPGSQRRYFEKLFARLKKVKLPIVLEISEDDRVARASPADARTLEKCAFIQTIIAGRMHWQCANCRMVPYDYRAPGSLFFTQPTAAALVRHNVECQKDDIYWGTIQFHFNMLNNKYGRVTPLVEKESFVQLIRSVVGSEVEVINAFMMKLGKNGQSAERSSSSGIWRRLPMEVDFNDVQKHFSILWKDLGISPVSLADSPDVLKFLQLLSCNFQVPRVKNDEVQKKDSNLTTSVPNEQSRSVTGIVSEPEVVNGKGTNESIPHDSLEETNVTIIQKTDKQSSSQNILDEQRTLLPARSEGMNGKRTKEKITIDRFEGTELNRKKKGYEQISSQSIVASNSNDEFLESNTASVMAASNHSLIVQPMFRVSEEEVMRSKSILCVGARANDRSEEILLGQTRLTFDQGTSVMDNIESGQFDDA